MSKLFTDDYNAIISTENLLEAWKEFIRGKHNRRDVQGFEKDLMANLFALHEELASKAYAHSAYKLFHISDPKPRVIHKACVRDRLLHRALYRKLYSFFENKFIADSFSCQLGKGTHRAINRFRSFYYTVSRNNTRTCWVLKCDIRKFFASIDQQILLGIVKRHIPDSDIIWLVQNVVESFSSTALGKGLPLGNLTSQLLANVYMNEFDQFVKHDLRVRHYIRYADDFVFLSLERQQLEDFMPKISDFLQNNLRLQLHPDKVYIKTMASGVDYLGLLSHGNTRKLQAEVLRRSKCECGIS